MSYRLSRGAFTAMTATAFSGIGMVRSPARAAQYQFKYGNDQSLSSPVTVRAIEMWKTIERETNGRLSVQTFPDSQLGGDTQMVAQLRSGALQFLTEAGAILGNVVPLAQMDGVAFAYKDETTAFAAMDGSLGAIIRDEIVQRGIHAFPNPWDNGFREITANKPVRSAADLDGLKIRVPSSPLFVDLFRTLGATPTPINVSELYTSLQTHIVEAQENALININQSRLYEVQKTLNFSNHAWGCWWFLANLDMWNGLPPDIQQVVTRNVVKFAHLQRRDFAALTSSLTDKLHRLGMTLYSCDIPSFKARLKPYYAKWKGEFGAKAWTELERYSGPLGA
ncbi:MAG TPA: TRAP transporter substrate-binding protein [Candidatus Baltobacteraceae bacterium]|nr:TRAP transporter substrate-binding protein [Candidatus Baltobacteraceae bacterium]